MKKDWKDRKTEVIKSILILLGIGVLYALFSTLTGVRIPCVFYVTTGLYCPGCGVTRLCLALLRLDIRTAFACNPLLFLTLPLFGGLFGYLMYRYIRYGNYQLGTWGNRLAILLLILFLGFGVLRNLPGMEMLCPPE